MSSRGSMGPMMGGGMMPPGGVARRAAAIKVVSLKHAAAPDLSAVLSRVFPQADVTPEPRSNKLIIRADDDTQAQLAALIQQARCRGKRQSVTVWSILCTCGPRQAGAAVVPTL